MSDSDEDEVLETTVKITLVGEPSTGKSMLCARYLGVAHGGSNGGGGGVGGTQGAEVLAGRCLALRPPVPLQLCDVAGAALATPMLDNYLYASHIIILVYDLTNLASFEKLSAWITKVKDLFSNESTQPLLALFGNKSDLEHQRAVRLSCVQKLASQHLLDNFKGSARTGEAVNSTITTLVAKVLGRPLQLQPISQLRAKYSTQPSNVSQNGNTDTLGSKSENTQPLIMHRKAFRAIQRKANSAVCELQ